VPVPLLSSALGVPGVIANESFGSTSSFAIAVLSLVTIVLGYALLMVLWFYVFREKPQEKEARRQREAAAMRAAGHPDNAVARGNDDDRVDAGRVVADESPPRHGRPLKIEPRMGTRFRRR
jgi:hypothetical protein